MLNIINIIGLTLLGFLIGAILGTCMFQMAYLIFEHREVVLAVTLIIIGFPITIPYIVYKLIQEHRKTIASNKMTDAQKEQYWQKDLAQLQDDGLVEIPDDINDKFLN